MKLSGSWKEIGWIPGFDLFELSPSLSNTGPRIDRDHEEQGHRGKRSKIMNDPRQRTFQNNTSHSPLQPSPCWGAPAGLIYVCCQYMYSIHVFYACILRMYSMYVFYVCTLCV